MVGQAHPASKPVAIRRWTWPHDSWHLGLSRERLFGRCREELAATGSMGRDPQFILLSSWEGGRGLPRAGPVSHMLESIVGKHLRLYLPNGWVFEPWFTGADFIEYHLEAGPHKDRHAIQVPALRRPAPGIEILHWVEETGTHVNLTWYLDTGEVDRYASVPRWLADHDMTVTTGWNRDPEYLAKIEEMAAEGPDMPRHVYADRGYFEILDEDTIAKHEAYFGKQRNTPKLNAHPYAHKLR